MSRLLRLVAVVAVSATLANVSVAHAATVWLTSNKLTTHTSALEIPPQSHTVTFEAVADAFVRESCGGTSDGTTNFGRETELEVASAETCPDARALVRFDIGDLPKGIVNITRAALTLDCVTEPESPPTYQAFRVSSAWDEMTVTFATQPAESGAPANIDRCADDWDVTGDVRAFYDGTEANFGWLLRDRDEADPSNPVTQWASRESGVPPRLVVTYTI